MVILHHKLQQKLVPTSWYQSRSTYSKLCRKLREW